MSDLKVLVTKRYGEKTVLNRLSFTAPDGKITCILGYSGSGKTTLLRCISHMTAYEGSIEGADGAISYLFQEDRLIPYLTVQNNLRFVLSDAPRAESDAKIAEMLRFLEIEEAADRYPATLSGGQKLRVAMARAFLYPSELLLLDEPFRSLDVGLKHRLLQVFLRLYRKRKKTVIFVTHGIDEALLCADRVGVLGRRPAEAVFVCDITEKERKLSDPVLSELRQTLLTELYEKGETEDDCETD